MTKTTHLRRPSPVPTDVRSLAVIHADGGTEVGFGHIGRCLAIFEELGGRAAAFATDNPSVIGFLTSRGAAVLPAESVGRVVVLDRASEVDPDEVRQLRAQGAKVVLIDDGGPARDIADLVVDPPTGPAWPPVPHGRRLGGFEHVLLRREICAARTAPVSDIGVLVSLGGSDPEGLTPAVMEALSGLDVPVAAVLGPGYRGPALAGSLPPEMWPRAMAGARLVVTRFGHTLLEAAHLGVPALALAREERDRVDAAAFSRYGTAEWLDVCDPPHVAFAVTRLLSDPDRLANMAARGRALIDGHGATRVAAAILELS